MEDPSENTPKPSWNPMAGDEEGNQSAIDKHRKKYRLGGKDFAVKVYTINQESKYLLIKDVPALGLKEEFLELCGQFGPIEEYRLLDEWDVEDEYTEVYWVKYQDINSAQIAKRKLDDFPFYHKLLQVSYAPQFETLADTREKILDRKKHISDRLQPGYYAEKTSQQDSKFYKIPAIDASQVNPYLMPFAPQTPSDHTAFQALKPGQMYPQLMYEQQLPQPRPTQNPNYQHNNYIPQEDEPQQPRKGYYENESLNKTVETIRNKLQKSAASKATPEDRPSATTNPQISKRRRI